MDETSGKETGNKNGKRKNKAVLERIEGILKVVKEQGFVSIDSLSDRFGVTPQTIRRDISRLNREGRVHRYHGGAGNMPSTVNVDYSERKVLCLKEKRQIAGMVADKIPDNASIFINIGTTTEEVAKTLSMNHHGLRVITNNLNVAIIMSGNEDFEVIVTGGLIRNKDKGIVGEATIDFIRQFKVDYGIIGISSIDSDGTLLDFDYREVRAARAIIENSREVFLAADHTKFGRNAMVRLGKIDEINAVFTDRRPSPSMEDMLSEAEVSLYVGAKYTTMP